MLKMDNKSKIPMCITLKQLNKSNNVKIEHMQIKKNSNFKKFKMLPCLYDVIEGPMRIKEAA